MKNCEDNKASSGRYLVATVVNDGASLPGFSAESNALRSCKEKRRQLQTLRKQAYRLNTCCSEFFTELLNSKFRECLDGEIEVTVVGRIDYDFQSLQHFHCEYEVYFLPRNFPEYNGLPRTVMPTRTQIDIREAELSPVYASESVARGWPLTHASIVEMLEYLDVAGMEKIDSVIGDAAFWLERTAIHGDEPSWLTLQKLRTSIADRIEEMVAAIRE